MDILLKNQLISLNRNHPPFFVVSMMFTEHTHIYPTDEFLFMDIADCGNLSYGSLATEKWLPGHSAFFITFL